ncbi:MAG: hypothetical protein V5A72_00985 [Candidatus Nanohaloarchaea archaeon]
MDILGAIPGIGSGNRNEEPEYETIYSGKVHGYEPRVQDNQMIFNPHQMLGDTVGDVEIWSTNPYGSEEIDDEVSSVKALKLFDDTATHVAKNNDGEFGVKYKLQRSDDGRIDYDMSVSFHAPQLQQSAFQMMDQAETTFEGTLAENLPKHEVENFLSQYGFDRTKDNWEFNNLEGNLDEFLEPGDYGTVFSPSSEAAKQAVVSGEVRSANYLGEDYSHWSDTEIISALLEESLNSPEVRKMEHSGRFNYEILVDDGDLEGEEIRLDIVSSTPLFDPSLEHSEDDMEREV